MVKKIKKLEAEVEKGYQTLRETHDEFLKIPIVQLERKRRSLRQNNRRSLPVLLKLVPRTAVFRGDFTLPPNWKPRFEHDQWPGISKNSRNHYIGNSSRDRYTLDFLFNDTTCTVMPLDIANDLLKIGKIDPHIVPERRARYDHMSTDLKREDRVETPDHIIGFLHNCVLNNHPSPTDYELKHSVFDKKTYFEKYHSPAYFSGTDSEGKPFYTEEQRLSRVRELDQERIDILRKFIENPYRGFAYIKPMPEPGEREDWPLFAQPISPKIFVTAEAITGFKFLK